MDTSQRPRLDDDQDALPESYSPLGAARTLGRIDELVTVGFSLASVGSGSTFTVFKEVPQGLQGTLGTSPLFTPTPATTPWARSVGAAPETLRAADAGDVDGDGVDETVVLAWSAAGGGWLRVWDDKEASPRFAAGPEQPIDLGGTPERLALALGDFDGDGVDDAVVASTSASGARLAFFRSGTSGFEPFGAPIAIDALSPAPAVEVDLAVGNLDYDAGLELAVVVNEVYRSGTQEVGLSRWFVYDDGPAHALAGTGRVDGTVAGFAHTAVLAGVAAGDLDNDGVDEVAFGGLDGLDPSGACRYGYVLVALDDLKRGLAPLGAGYVPDALGVGTAQAPGPNACDAADPLRLRRVHVRAFDLDEDGAAEVQVNQLTFDDLDFRADEARPAEGTAPWSRRGELPLELLFGTRETSGVRLAGTFDATTSAVATGDFTADGREDVAFVSQLAGGAPALRIWRYATKLGDPNGDSWHEATAVPISAASFADGAARPLVVAANVDRDSLALRYSTGTYQLVFTEPVVLAALAAPPCSAKFGQDVGACVTSFGKAVSDTSRTEDTWTVTAGGILGFKVGKAVTVETTAEVKKYWSQKTTHAYSLTRRVLYTTGPLEDVVVFTTVPYDVYTYRILSHPTPGYVGRDLVMMLPREPITVAVERGYYNAHVPSTSPQVDAAVFAHTPGDPSSYRTAAQKNALVAPYYDLGDMSVGPETVGEGTGRKTLQMNAYDEWGSATSEGISAELKVKGTAGWAILGFSVGGSFDHHVRTSHGRDTLYAGTVSNMPAGEYEAHAYSWGLFTYVHASARPAGAGCDEIVCEGAPMNGFEVVDYWVQ